MPWNDFLWLVGGWILDHRPITTNLNGVGLSYNSCRDKQYILVTARHFFVMPKFRLDWWSSNQKPFFSFVTRKILGYMLFIFFQCKFRFFALLFPIHFSSHKSSQGHSMFQGFHGIECYIHLSNIIKQSCNYIIFNLK